MSTVEKFAPYPRDEDAVTADRLARHMAVAAQLTNSQIFTSMHARDAAEGTDRAEKDSPLAKLTAEVHHLTLVNAINEYAIVHLLRALIEHAPGQADEVAKDLWGVWEDGGAVGEWIWEWLTGYGIDPEAVRKAAEALEVSAA